MRDRAELHATVADTLPSTAVPGGNWFVDCLRPECGWHACGEYQVATEEQALRVAHGLGTHHEQLNKKAQVEA